MGEESEAGVGEPATELRQPRAAALRQLKLMKSLRNDEAGEPIPLYIFIFLFSLSPEVFFFVFKRGKISAELSAQLIFGDLGQVTEN